MAAGPVGPSVLGEVEAGLAVVSMASVVDVSAAVVGGAVSTVESSRVVVDALTLEVVLVTAASVDVVRSVVSASVSASVGSVSSASVASVLSLESESEEQARGDTASAMASAT
jgi:hypothetical protein